MDSRDKAAITGRINRQNGELFEKLVQESCRRYEMLGICAIDKTPEPMRPLKPYPQHNGWFVAAFTKQAQPDFKGILVDSTMVLFDAKHTETGRVRRQIVSQEQEECFERYSKHGARCFILVSLGFSDFYRIPWEVFRDMKKIYGRKYMGKKDLKPYRVQCDAFLLHFLDGIELKGGEESEDTERRPVNGNQTGTGRDTAKDTAGNP